MASGPTTTPASARDLGHGRATIAVTNTAVRVVPAQTEAVSISIRALLGNAGTVFIGDSTVTAAGGAAPGYELGPGDGVDMDLEPEFDPPYINGTAGYGVCWLRLK